jgi:beta-1,4-mannosyl-glycoprotein beta-1,4-N-acetylglucosaminyltransferase
MLHKDNNTKNHTRYYNIYDCFTFFNELELLEIRLNTLYDYVDKFVIVEATKSHTNQPKELFFENNKEKFKQFSDKIIHIIVDEFPPIIQEWFAQDIYENNEKKGNWGLENFQRNQIMKGLIDANDEDVIIITDLDEIPVPERIAEYKEILERPDIKLL